MQQVIKQIKERYKIDLQSQDINYQLWRLDDTEYIKLQKNSLPIADKSKIYRDIYLSRNEPEQNKLNLAQLLTILEWLFGETSDLHDHWKGAFFFPTLLTIIKKNGTFYYLIDIYDHRGWLYFRLYRIIEHGIEEQDKQILQEAFNLEFSQQEINYFFSYFYGYLIGCFRILKKINPVQPFLKTIDSNWILYGYKEEEYFEKHCNSEEVYQAEIKSFEEFYGSNKTDVSAILQRIIGEPSEV